MNGWIRIIFCKILLLDNFLLVDIYNRAKKLGIAIEARRVVFLIEPKKRRRQHCYGDNARALCDGNKGFHYGGG